MQYIAGATLAIYAAIGVLPHSMALVTRKISYGEQYPFFSWFLFAKIPNPQSTLTMRMLSYGDTTYDPPLPFDKTSFIFRAVGQYSTQYLPVIRSFGGAIEKGEDTSLYRKRLENIFLKPARYQIVRIQYDPVDYWRSRAIKKEVLLGTFTTHDAEKNLTAAI
jgi:hypothetical protein